MSNVKLDRSHRLSLALHEEVARQLTDQVLAEWAPTLLTNVRTLSQRVTGQPHLKNLQEWSQMITDHDLSKIKSYLTGKDIRSVEMREVTPFQGFLSQEQRFYTTQSSQGNGHYEQ